MRLLINGCFGHDNLGDEAILRAFAARSALRNVTLTPITGNPGQTLRQHGLHGIQRRTVAPFRIWRPTRIRYAWELRREAARAGGALLGGGGVLVDLFAGDVVNYLAPLEYSQRAGRPTAAFCIGGEHLFQKSSRRAVREILCRADAVSVRDQATAELLQSCGVPGSKLCLGADPALAMAASSLGAKVPPNRTGGVVFVPCAYLGGSDAESQQRRDFWIDLGKRLSASGLDLAVVPLSPRDAAWLKSVTPQLKISPVPSLSEFIELLAAADCVVAEKLHGSILAAAQGTPFVSLAYRRKVQAFADEAKLGDWCFPAGHGELLPFDIPSVDAVHELVQSLVGNAVSSRRRVDTARIALLQRLEGAYDATWSGLGVTE